ncbi:MAG: Uma2 family endonuclease [Bacteroidota bacterium]
MESLIDQVLASPKAPSIIDELQVRMAEEKAKREAFYAWLDEDKKAEFVNGEVVVHSPVRKWHTLVTKRLLILLDLYVTINNLGFVGVEKTLIKLRRNDFEPDLCFFPKEIADQFKEDQMYFPAPSLVVEVLSSNEDHDRVVKYQDYEANGVKEYWIINPKEQFVEQYKLNEEGKYELLLKSSSGDIESYEVKGFRIPIKAMFDEAENLRVSKELLG